MGGPGSGRKKGTGGKSSSKSSGWKMNAKSYAKYKKIRESGFGGKRWSNRGVAKQAHGGH